MPDRVRRTVKLARRAWRALGDAEDSSARADLEAYVLDEVLRRPLLFEDGRGLRYILFPGENARAYLEHNGNYEVAETRFCENRLRPGMTGVDAGAHIGLYTLLFARLVGPAGHVYAFEPAPANRRRLEENIALNHVDNVVVEEAALFSETGRVVLNLFPDQLGAWHSLGRPLMTDPERPYATVTPSSSLEVPCTTLDDYATKHQIERIDLLKVDVEGAEADVFAGSRSLLASRRVSVVLFEVSLVQTEALGHAAAAAFKELESAGFVVCALEQDGSVRSRAIEPLRRYANYVALPHEAAPPPR
jgi:FkbM family methyltransferase